MTFSDAFPAAEPPSITAAVPERARVHARTRARGYRSPSVVGKAKTVYQVVADDVTGAWVWRDAPPSLRQLAASRAPDADAVPAGHGGLRRGWWAYNHLVALPVSAVAYFLTWVVQHPARLLLAVVLVAPILAAVFAG